MKLPEHATLEQAAELAATMPAGIGQGTGAVELDASALTDFDSSTIALMLHARRLAQAAGRGFSVVGAPAQLTELARLYGVEELLSLSGPRSTTL